MGGGAEIFLRGGGVLRLCGGVGNRCGAPAVAVAAATAAPVRANGPRFRVERPPLAQRGGVGPSQALAQGPAGGGLPQHGVADAGRPERVARLLAEVDVPPTEIALGHAGARGVPTMG